MSFKSKKPPMLTSLLDLFIIIIFAQLISARNTVEVAEQSQAAAIDSLAEERESRESYFENLYQSLLDQEKLEDEIVEFFNVANDNEISIQDSLAAFEIALAMAFLEELNVTSEEDLVNRSRQLTEVMQRVAFCDIYLDGGNYLNVSLGDRLLLSNLSTPEMDADSIAQAIQGVLFAESGSARLVVALLMYHEESHRPQLNKTLNALRIIAEVSLDLYNVELIISEPGFDNSLNSMEPI